MGARVVISDEAVLQLTAALEELSPSDRDDVARVVAVLWGSLIFHFGGLDSYLASDRDAQVAYLGQLTSTATRLAPRRRAHNGHRFLAVASLSAYLAGWLEPRSDASIALATQVVTALVRGRSIMQRSGPTREVALARAA